MSGDEPVAAHDAPHAAPPPSAPTAHSDLLMAAAGVSVEFAHAAKTTASDDTIIEDEED